MKRWGKLTALLLAVVMMLCACDPNTNTNTEDPNKENTNGKLTITVALPENADYANVSLNGEKVVKYTAEPLVIELAPGSYTLKFTALADNNFNALATCTKEITIEAKKAHSIEVKTGDWVIDAEDTKVKVTIAGLPEYADSVKLTINDVSVNSSTYPTTIELNKGTYILKADAYSKAYSETISLASTTTSFEVTDGTGKTITLKNWTAADLEETSFTFKCNVPSDAVKYSFVLDNKNHKNSIELNHYHYTNPFTITSGIYELKAYIYGADHKLMATGAIDTIVLKPGVTNKLEYTDFEWKPFTGESKNVTLTIGLIPYEGADSHAILVNNEFKGENTTGEMTLDNTSYYDVEGYAFKNGNLIAHTISTEYPYTMYDSTNNYRMNGRGSGLVTVNNPSITDKTVTSYMLKIDNGDFIEINDKKDLELTPGDHHMEAYAFDGKNCIAVIYKEFNVMEYSWQEIKLDWNTEMNFLKFKESIEDEISGYRRMDNSPLNRLSQEELNVIASKIATAMGLKADNIKPVVENNNLTVDINLGAEKWHLTQNADGTLKNVITEGNTVETIYYANLPDFEFDHAKIISDYNTAYGIMKENDKVTHKWASFLITSKDEMEKFMAVNKFSTENITNGLNAFNANPTKFMDLYNDNSSLCIRINPRKTDTSNNNIYNIQIFDYIK